MFASEPNSVGTAAIFGLPVFASAVGPTSDAKTGKANIAAVPSEFGSLANIQLTIGKPKPDGSRTILLLETPSLNSLVYDFVACQA